MSMPPQPRPPGWQQGPWPPQPPPPLPDFAPDKKNTVKWVLSTVAVLVVLGVTIGGTLYFTRDKGGGGSATSSSAAPSDVASANDRGPVSIISEEPTCDAYIGINNGIAAVEKNGWADGRATLGPSSEWTSDQRTQIEAVATALRNASDQMVSLAKQTPHRVVRELYEQFIAYGRAYAERLPEYTPKDDGLASANVNTGVALLGICNAIRYGAAARTLAVPPASAPTESAPVNDVSNPQRFIPDAGSVCSQWTRRLNQLTADTPDWQNLDGGIPAPQWSPERRATEQRIRPLFTTYANDMEAAGRQSGNPILEDFAVLASQYLRAYVAIGDDYNGAADSWLANVAFSISNLVSGACLAVTE